MTRAPVAVWILSLAAAWAAEEPWFRAIEISSESGPGGQADYSVRFTPARTHACSRIVFECVYRQVLSRTAPDGKQVKRVHEPVRFSYKRMDIRLVSDLDHEISFRVPMSFERLEAMYGARTFSREHEVAVDRLLISGYDGDVRLWSYELKAPGKYGADALRADPAASAGTEGGKESLEGLDVDAAKANPF